MPRDYEDIFDLDDLNDQELRELVRDALARHDGIDADSLVVLVAIVPSLVEHEVRFELHVVVRVRVGRFDLRAGHCGERQYGDGRGERGE